MNISRTTSCQLFTIFQPRWKDRSVLLACYKVGTHNKIVFTKAPSMGTDHYYVSGETVRSCPQQTNGKIMCYCVPVDKLEPLEVI
jgi:hypothetical protein